MLKTIYILLFIYNIGVFGQQKWVLDLCKNRESHWVHGNHSYIYSGQSALLKSEEKANVKTGAQEAELNAVVRDWSSAGDWCQLRCMDLVSLETQEEWDMVRNKMEEAKAKFIWTSGHICDREVGQQCFTDKSLQPRLINGWFWSGSGVKISATDKTPPGWNSNPWGTTGIFTQVRQQKNPDAAPVPQPDNGEQRLKLLEKKEESCLALASGLWQDETVWNDIACYHPKEWICEDSDIFLAQAGLL